MNDKQKAARDVALKIAYETFSSSAGAYGYIWGAAIAYAAKERDERAKAYQIIEHCITEVKKFSPPHIPSNIANWVKCDIFEHQRNREEIQKLVEALEHYASMRNWRNADLAACEPHTEYDWDCNGYDVAQKALAAYRREA
jgi:hypothetical protein